VLKAQHSLARVEIPYLMQEGIWERGLSTDFVLERERESGIERGRAWRGVGIVVCLSECWIVGNRGKVELMFRY
jgi:hypothetical protein